MHVDNLDVGYPAVTVLAPDRIDFMLSIGLAMVLHVGAVSGMAYRDRETPAKRCCVTGDMVGGILSALNFILDIISTNCLGVASLTFHVVTVSGEKDVVSVCFLVDCTETYFMAH